MPIRLHTIVAFSALVMLSLQFADFIDRDHLQSLNFMATPSIAASGEEDDMSEEEELKQLEKQAEEEGVLLEEDEPAEADTGGLLPTVENVVEGVPTYSEAELEILSRLAQRRKELEQRSQNIEKREDVLLITEKRIDTKIEALRALREEVQGLLASYENRETEKIQSLVKIYENMKPKDAAKIMEELDIAILLSVITEMSERKLAPVLAKMKPERAQEVTTAFAEEQRIRRQIKLD